MSEALTYSNQYSSHHHGHAWYLPTGAGQRELANSEAFRIDKADCTARVQQISCWSVPINPCKFALASKARTLSKEWLNTCPFRLGFITRERLPMYFIVRDQKAMLLKGMVVIGFVQ